MFQESSPPFADRVLTKPYLAGYLQVAESICTGQENLCTLYLAAGRILLLANDKRIRRMESDITIGAAVSGILEYSLCFFLLCHILHNNTSIYLNSYSMQY